MLNLNRRFIWSMAISVFGTVLATLLQWHPIVVLLFGVAPLVYYFVALLALSKQGISQTAVDSVYYFGFIVTIASLAASVLSVAFFGIDRELNLLIAQFGVGLLATGLALVFRMVLLAKIESLNQKDISEAIEEYVKRIDHVVTRVEATSANFEGLSNSLIQRTENVIQQAQSSFHDAMTATAETFRQELIKTVAEFGAQTSNSIKIATESSQEFFGLVKSISLSGHVQDITEQVGAISAGLKVFSEETRLFAKSNLEEMHANTTAYTRKAHEDFAVSLDSVIGQTSEGLSLLLKEIGSVNFGAETTEVKTQLQSLARNISAYTKKIEGFEKTKLELVEGVSRSTGEAIGEKLLPVFQQLSTEAQSIQQIIVNLGSIVASESNRQVELAITGSLANISQLWEMQFGQFGNAMHERMLELHESLLAVENSIDLTGIQEDFNQFSISVQAMQDVFASLNESIQGVSAVANEGKDALIKVKEAAESASEVLLKVQHTELQSVQPYSFQATVSTP